LVQKPILFFSPQGQEEASHNRPESASFFEGIARAMLQKQLLEVFMGLWKISNSSPSLKTFEKGAYRAGARPGK
jgi:hypothetical protein